MGARKRGKTGLLTDHTSLSSRLVDLFRDRPGLEGSVAELAELLGGGPPTKKTLDVLCSMFASTGLLLRRRDDTQGKYVYRAGNLAAPRSLSMADRLRRAAQAAPEPVEVPVPLPAPVEPPSPVLEPPKAPVEVPELPGHPPQAEESPAVVGDAITAMLRAAGYAVADEIIGHIRARLLERVADLSSTLKAHVAEAVPIRPEELAQRIVDAATPLRLKLPRVLIVGGFKGEQKAALDKAWSQSVELMYFDGYEQGLGPLRQLAISAEHCFVMLGATSHKQTDIIKVTGTPYTMVPGGRSSLDTYLSKFVARQLGDQEEAA